MIIVDANHSSSVTSLRLLQFEQKGEPVDNFWHVKLNL